MLLSSWSLFRLDDRLAVTRHDTWIERARGILRLKLNRRIQKAPRRRSVPEEPEETGDPSEHPSPRHVASQLPPRSTARRGGGRRNAEEDGRQHQGGGGPRAARRGGGGAPRPRGARPRRRPTGTRQRAPSRARRAAARRTLRSTSRRPPAVPRIAGSSSSSSPPSSGAPTARPRVWVGSPCRRSLRPSWRATARKNSSAYSVRSWHEASPHERRLKSDTISVPGG